MDWDSSHLKSTSCLIPATLQAQVCLEAELADFQPDRSYIAIVGAGPKGFYALDSLLNAIHEQVKQGHVLGKELHIHWFNRDQYFGTGPYFKPETPTYFQLNTCIADLSCWEEVTNPSRPFKGLSLLAWIQQHQQMDKPVAKADYCSRELYGHYLSHALQQVLQHTPDKVQVSFIQAEVIDVDMQGQEAFLHSLSQKLPYPYQSVIFTTGHHTEDRTFAYLKMPHEEAPVVINSIYPFSQLEVIPPKAEVALYGTGLTFVDAMLEFTEGRGGIFYRKEQEIHYISSGLEPILFPFSRRSLANLPHAPFWKGHKYQLRLMTDAWVDSILHLNRPIDFLTEILPVFDEEVQLAFFELLPEFEGFQTEDILAYIRDESQEKLFSIYAMVNPIKYAKLDMSGNYHEFIVDLSNYCLEMAEYTEFTSPMAAANAAMREGYSQITRIFNSLGFSTASRNAFDDSWSPNIKHLGNGPSLHVSQKFFCLLKEGFIQFLFSEKASVTRAGDKVRLKNKYLEKDFDYLIHARVPKIDLRLKNNRLYSNLKQKGLIQEHIQEGYSVGSIQVDKQGRASGLAGDFPLYLYGMPAEGTVINNDTLRREQNNFAEPWAKSTLALLLKTAAISEK